MVAPAHAPCSFIRPVWAALIAVAAVAIGACTTLRAYPTLTLQRRLVAAGEQLDEAAIRRLLRAAPTLSAAPRAALVVLDSADAGARLNERDRSAMIESLRQQMASAPFASVAVLPTGPSGWYSSGLETGSPFDELRSAAARFRADVLVLVTTAASSYQTANPLAVTYIALVPMYFVPGSDVSVYASAEACALDVASGIFLGCAAGHGAAKEDFVPLFFASDAFSELSRRALDKATRDLPRQVAGTIYAHLGAGNRRYVGRRYETEAAAR